jgi:hypothetical protein
MGKHLKTWQFCEMRYYSLLLTTISCHSFYKRRIHFKADKEEKKRRERKYPSTGAQSHWRDITKFT